MDVPVQIIANAANEGIPVAAIARITQEPMDVIYDTLHDMKDRGTIAELPRADWPPGTRTHDRVPDTPMPSNADLAFMCKQAFRLTSLEAGFLVALLKNRQVEKTRLHHIVEQQRLTRQSQPNEMESTDPKMVDVMICKLRRKLKTVDAKLLIETIWGGGYFIKSAIKPLIMAHMNGDEHASQESPAPAEPAQTPTRH